MVRQFRIIGRRINALFCRPVRTGLLAAAVAMIASGAAQAITPAQLAAQDGREANPLLTEVGACPDGSYDCPAYAPPRPAPEHAAYDRTPPPGVYYEPAPAEELPPCAHPRYAARDHYGRVPPPRDYYDYKDCGVRCWYRRLRRGYCGRGCDYYRFRLKEFPEGKFDSHRRRRLACRGRP